MGRRLRRGLRVGAPSMVFGRRLRTNLERLADLVDHVEVVLFHTPEIHNLPSSREAEALAVAARTRGISLSIHLPTTLEPAAPDRTQRREAVALAARICAVTRVLEPEHYVLHVPALPPTLVSVPGRFLDDSRVFDWRGWEERAREALEELAAAAAPAPLLVENINYPVHRLAPLWGPGVGLCLDLGHLLLAGEEPGVHLERYLGQAGEVHLHGVVGHEEHLGLDRLPAASVREWVTRLQAGTYRGPVTLEMFSPEELSRSLAIVDEALAASSGCVAPERVPHGELRCPGAPSRQLRGSGTRTAPGSSDSRGSAGRR